MLERTFSESTWPRRSLGDLTERIFVGLADARHRSDLPEREVPLVNVKDLRDGRLPPIGELGGRTVPATADVDRYQLRREDVVVTCRGSQLKVAMVAPETAGALASANLLTIRTNPELLPAVLFAFFRTPEGHAALLQRGRSSTASLLITPKAVAEIAIPLPPIEVQRQIAELVTAAEDNFIAAVRAAEQRRAVARAVARELLHGDVQHHGVHR